jgi:hypothetical protein
VFGQEEVSYRLRGDRLHQQSGHSSYHHQQQNQKLTCRALIAGGGAPEIHVSRLLTQHAQTLKGKEAYCFQAYAEALEVIPTTLAENAGLNPISIVTELRNKHAMGERNAGINVKKVRRILLLLSPSFTFFFTFFYPFFIVLKWTGYPFIPSPLDLAVS